MFLGESLMTRGSINVKLLESDSQIQKKLYESLAFVINRSITKNSKKVINILKAEIGNWIRSQPEIESLLNSGPGSLNAQFGLPQGTADNVVNEIINTIVNDTTINIKNVDKNLNGNIEFNFQRSDFSNLLSMSAGHVITEKNTDLHWLDWLLTRGDTTIIIGYGYTPNTKGRSGGGTMNYLNKAWRVPPQFSGTIDNNFIIRAFDKKETEIVNMLQELFK